MKEEQIVKIYNSGNFYNVFGKSGYLIHYLFNYKFIPEKGGVGFPKSALPKVESILIEKHISYEIYEKKELIRKENFDNNKYSFYCKKAIKQIDYEKRLLIIQEKLNAMDEEQLNSIIEAIDNAIL